MSQTFSCITTTRDDLVAISRIMAEAMNPAWLTDKERPFLISVDGSFRSGKSIFKDVIREKTFEDHSTGFKGFPDMDEYWISHIDGKNIEIDYMDAAWHNDYFNPRLDTASGCSQKMSDKKKLKRFMEARKHGGISIVQNCNMPKKADIQIFVESRYDRRDTASSEPTVGLRRVPPALKDLHDATHEVLYDTAHWVRYVEITLKDGRVLNDMHFVSVIADFTHAANDRARQFATQYTGPQNPENSKIRPIAGENPEITAHFNRIFAVTEDTEKTAAHFRKAPNTLRGPRG